MGTHPVNISTIIMNSVKCVAAALMLASSVVNGARVRRDDGYGAPQEDTYGAPAESYGAPVESYGASAPSYGAAAETGLDLTTIIIPPWPSSASSSSSPPMSPSPASEGRERLLMIPKFLSMLLRE